MYFSVLCITISYLSFSVLLYCICPEINFNYPGIIVAGLCPKLCLYPFERLWNTEEVCSIFSEFSTHTFVSALGLYLAEMSIWYWYT